jgi:hypothetical protein
MPRDLQSRIDAILSAHSTLPRPQQAGASIGIRRKP